ncbi:hypothetical protein [Alicyclobacillus macrosporangiidus]|uniref:hypothetical protein n=1 Tax=Alicyclobacillus macrosporangiidus TaxID=392015 RepID=UPI0034E9345F
MPQPQIPQRPQPQPQPTMMQRVQAQAQQAQQTAFQPGQQAGPQMTTPPQVITTKDASYIKDQLSWLLVAAKKCAHYAKECSDASVASAIQRIGQMHQRHYQLLLGHLKTNNQQAMQNIPQPPQQTH